MSAKEFDVRDISRRDFLKMSGIGLAGIATFGAAACGGTDGGQGGMGGSIEVWIMQPGSDELEGLLRGFADDFMKENEGAEINLQFVPWANAHDQFVTAIGGGQVPDLAEMGTTWTPEFASLGGLSPLGDELGSGDYIESLVDSGTYEDQSYGFPWYGGARALIYRSDVLDELGISVPESWEELIQAGQRIKQEREDIFPFGVVGDYNHMFLPMVWQAGGEIAVQEGDAWRSRMDSSEAIEAFGTYGEMFREMDFSPDGALNWNSADLRDAFTNGDFAMMVGGGWDLSAILDGAPDLEGSVQAALLPQGPGGNRDTFAGGSHLVVFEESENKELATAFARHLMADEQVSKFAGELGFLPGTESGIEASEQANEELYAPFAEQLLDHSRTYPPVPEWGSFEGDAIFVNAIQNIMRGEEEVESAMNEVASKMNQEFGG